VSDVLPDLDDSYVERFGRVALDGEIMRFTEYSEPLDRHYDISAYPLGGGRFVVTFQDVTAALEHERQLEDIIDQMEDVIFVHDPDGTFRTVNQAAVDRYGYSAAALQEMRPADLVGEAGAQTAADRIDEIMTEGSLVFETVHRTKSGEQIPVEINATRFTYDGEPSILAIARDITARKERARELEESERRYRSLFESNPAVIWEEDFSEMKRYLDDLAEDVEDMAAYVEKHPDVIEEMFDRIEVIDVSEQATERYGADSKEHLMANFPRLFTEQAYEANMEIALRIQQGETHFRVETSARTFDGEERNEIIDVNVPDPYAEDFSRVYLTVTDITERKAQEAELRTVKERLDLALEAGQLGVWDWDIPSDEVKRDERWAAILGHEPGAVTDDLQTWEQKVHPDDLPAADRALSEHLAGESTYYESEHRLQTAGGDWKWIREIGRITEYDDAGEPIRAVGVTEDIDEEKRAMKLLERQKAQLDEFATMVSHDLRNPLNVAQGRLDLAREGLESEDLAAVDNSLDRMDEIIDEVLTLTATGAEVQTDTLETIRLAAIARATWENVDTPDGSLSVLGDRSFRGNERRLQHVFENLYRNAVQHTEGAVEVAVGPLDDGFYVADDGSGIEADDREQIFESGYSTSKDGTGFGLAIVKKMVEAHGWTIEAMAAESGGARFEVTGIEPIQEPASGG
jgi:PAS domain S-box-containing protein